MSLQRSNTRFRAASSRGATPDSGDDSSSTLSPPDSSSNKLRKRSWANLDDDAPLATNAPSESRDREGSSEVPRKTPRQSDISDRDGPVLDPGRRHSQQTPHSMASTLGKVRAQSASPWQSLTQHFTLFLEDATIIANREGERLVAIRKIPGPNADRKVAMLGRIRHESFLAFLECFSHEGFLYAIFEHEIKPGVHLPITLSTYALGKRYPTESQLATILGQILAGLKYLESLGLEHGSLTCRNILISSEGFIRISGHECCHVLVSGRSSTKDIKGVGYIALELMHKESKHDGLMHVRDPHRWPLDSKSVQFVLRTEVAYSIDELLEVEDALLLHTTLSNNPRASFDELSEAEY
ncbi:hypothetical protein OIDMADRAFT_184853 [Oidiodendron maius Zn]|uniref:Protein kinase domain-containing protein n=1 Tax=Oidiodendron maius (strain Zn) TaxID=913774 RepID=A0A0C3GP12_OIDMZ|nr:hypothetical protein OIDMADRAFT_184853 [Oidiodendron maius Zn]